MLDSVKKGREDSLEKSLMTLDKSVGPNMNTAFMHCMNTSGLTAFCSWGDREKPEYQANRIWPMVLERGDGVMEAADESFPLLHKKGQIYLWKLP